MQMTISQEPLVGTDLTSCQNVAFSNLVFQDGRHLQLLIIAQNMKMTISQYRLMDFDQICVKMILAMSFFFKIK